METADVATRSGSDESPGRVLMINGDETTRVSVRAVAESIGVEVFAYPAVSDVSASDAAGPCCGVLNLTPDGPVDAALESLRAIGVLCPVIVVLPPTTVPRAVRLMESGVAAVVEKPCAAADLVGRIRRCLDEDRRRLHVARERADAVERLERLTPKESRTLSHILRGKTNREIAEDLGLSVRAVEDRRARTIRRTGATGILDLARMVYVAGWSYDD